MFVGSLVGKERSAVHRTLLRDWGIEVGNDTVIELGIRIMGGSPFEPVIVGPGFKNHEITRGLQGVLLPAPRSVRAAENKPSDISVSTLLETTADSWAERDLGSLKPGGKPAFDAGIDLKGPVPVGAVAWP